MTHAATHHVAIVGAGPAGAWAAYTLAMRGVRVTLLDPSHPREKPCGGGVTGRAFALVAPALAGRHLPACTVLTARFVDADSSTSTSVRLDGAAARAESDPPPLLVASRAEFDGALLAAALGAGVE